MPNKYLHVISEGPLMIVRCPGILRKDGEYYAAPKWAFIVKAVLGVMKTHGLKRNDLYSLYPAADPKSEEYSAYEAAYAGEDKMGSFWLYVWDEASQSFRLVRENTLG